MVNILQNCVYVVFAWLNIRRDTRHPFSIVIHALLSTDSEADSLNNISHDVTDTGIRPLVLS